jgi:hypothetical protein
MTSSTPPAADGLTRVAYGARGAAAFPRVHLVTPAASGYLLLIGEVDRRLPWSPVWLPASRAKRALLTAAKRHCAAMGAEDDVLSASVFRAVLAPPGGPDPRLTLQRGRVHVAGFDVVVLIETASGDAARRLRESAAFGALESRFRGVARYAETIAAHNVRRIGPVDHGRPGVFLFNYFAAESPAQNLAVWEYTAGWFQQETGLDNSTVLQPLDPGVTGYALINHCRWDHWRDVVPALVFKPSFRRYVLANFAANRTAPMPLLYRLA